MSRAGGHDVSISYLFLRLTVFPAAALRVTGGKWGGPPSLSNKQEKIGTLIEETFDVIIYYIHVPLIKLYNQY